MERLLGALAADDDPRDSDDPAAGRHRPHSVPLLSLPSSLRTARLRVTPAAVWGLVLVVVTVGVVLGVRVAWAERSAQPTPVPVAPAPTDPGDSTLGPADVPGAQRAEAGQVPDRTSDQAGAGDPPGPEPGDAGSATAHQDVVVHMIGAVRRPGVVPVPPGSRVTDAVDGAGGLSDDADLTRINLARVVGDGERIWVPVRGEEPPADVGGSPAGLVDGAPGATGAGGAASPDPDRAGPGPGTPLVDINTADQPLLETLPGVGPVTAQRILQWRSDNGRFSAPEELLEVSGIGPRTLEQLSPHITVGG